MFTSTQKVADFITEIKTQMDNAYDDVAYVSWVNEVEQDLYSKIIEDYEEHEFAVTTALSDVPITLTYTEDTETINFIFEDIRKVYVKKAAGQYEEYSKTSLAYIPVNSYYKTDEKLGYYGAADGDSVKVIFRRRPTRKSAANKSTDYLNLPDAYLKLYKYYAFAQICFLKREYGEGNNWLAQYNGALQDFIIWYNERKTTYGN